MNNLEKLNRILAYLKATFVGKDEIIDLLGVSLVARENIFLFGPPGTAKSAIVKALSECITNGKNFEYLLTKFTEPSEIFGPFDIRKLKEGELSTNIEGMMPQASLVFFDEIFNANSAILNGLLMALNEKIFRRGKETFHLPALMFVGASNLLPEDEGLEALFDRFLLRVRCDYVAPEMLTQVLSAGRKLDGSRKEVMASMLPEEVITLQQQCKQVDLAEVTDSYVRMVHAFRNVGIKVSDRRAVKCQNLIAASALQCGRAHAIISDLWVLRYIWDTEEQIEIIAGIVNHELENKKVAHSHHQAYQNNLPDAEKLMEDLGLLKNQWNDGQAGFEELNLIKDKLRYLQSQAKWLPTGEPKDHLENEIEWLWQNFLQAN